MLASKPLLGLLLSITLAVQLRLDAQAQAPVTPKDLDTRRQFPCVSNRAEWRERAREIREQVLVSCGLWPMPPKTPLNAHVFGKIERDGYSIEKVYLETYPGFFLAGNLYRPLNHGRGPFPAILNPHGHWGNGRMADEKSGSIAARCINFARQGMIAFSYDMVGYNDTFFADTPASRSFADNHRRFATTQADLLWNVSLMGLQTWNSIRALDFLESLPEVNRKRLACTGESGGGTQTFMLGAVDNRLAAQAPVVMVSHSMQGGCLCENAPGLRVQFSNMEISAAAAPRPQILVAASGDWTKDTLTVEGPSIAGVYSLLRAPDHFHYVRYEYDHNYNQTSREAVYGWFGKWLLNHGPGEPLPEQPYRKETDADLRVFPNGQLPAGALTQDQLIAQLKGLHESEWKALAPNTKGDLRKYQEIFLPAWRHTVQLDTSGVRPVVTSEPLRACGEFEGCLVSIQRPGETAPISATYWAPQSILERRSPRLAVLCSGEPNSRSASAALTPPTGLAQELLRQGVAVLRIDQFSVKPPEDQFSKYYATYNRTLLQERVRDLLTVCNASASLDPRRSLAFRVTLVGAGRAGLWALMAAPGADSVAADCARLPSHDEQSLLASDVYCPGIMTLGSFQGAAILAAPRSLLLHNTGSEFKTEYLRAAYGAAKAAANLTSEPRQVPDTQIASWILSQR